MDRAEKAQTVEGLKADFSANTLVVVAHYTGLTVAELTDLRQRMGKAEASFQVTKNRLARIAIRDTKFSVLDDLFRGPTGVALSSDRWPRPRSRRPMPRTMRSLSFWAVRSVGSCSMSTV